MIIKAGPRGWFKIDGVRDGDRTLAEQMMGLQHALDDCKGKRVLDLGCAEGLISREFARAGAREVIGIELLQPHLDMAKKVCKGLKNVRFICAHLDDYIKGRESIEREYDIVLALGIIHKLHKPEIPLRFAAKVCKDLLVFRAPAKKYNGMIKSKHTDSFVNVPKVLASEGFVEEALIPGVRGEAAQYWRRK